jgi:hypothetical protein
VEFQRRIVKILIRQSEWQAFVNQVHGDVRDEAQVRASRGMLAAITEPPAQMDQNSPLKTEKTDDKHDERAFHVRSKYLSHAALHSVQFHSHAVLRRGVHQCHEVTAPVETAEELFRQALRHLEEK